MTGTIWYGRDGKPLNDANLEIGSTEWLKEMQKINDLLSDYDYKVVEQTYGTDKDGKRLMVSTVWLGIDHSFGLEPNEKPVIFETMVFTAPKATPDKMGEREDLDYQVRYSTEAEAKAGHDKAVKEFLVEVETESGKDV